MPYHGCGSDGVYDGVGDFGSLEGRAVGDELVAVCGTLGRRGLQGNARREGSAHYPSLQGEKGSALGQKVDEYNCNSNGRTGNSGIMRSQ